MAAATPSIYKGPNIVQKAMAKWHLDLSPTVKKVLKIVVPIFLVLLAAGLGIGAAFLAPISWAPMIGGLVMLGTVGIFAAPLGIAVWRWGKSYGTELIKAENKELTDKKVEAFQKFGRYCYDVDFKDVPRGNTIQEHNEKLKKVGAIISHCPRIKKASLQGFVSHEILQEINKTKTVKLQVNLTDQLHMSSLYVEQFPENLRRLDVVTNKGDVLKEDFFTSLRKRCTVLKTLHMNNFPQHGLHPLKDMDDLEKVFIKVDKPEEFFAKENIPQILDLKRVRKIVVSYPKESSSWKLSSDVRKLLVKKFMVDLNNPIRGDKSVQLRKRAVPC